MKVKLYKLALILLFINSYALSLDLGNSAWVYGYKSNWINNINKVNSSKSNKDHFSYLFVNAGNVNIDPKSQKLDINYNNKIINKYHKKLPKIKIISNLSFWVKDTSFLDWEEENYIVAADKIAKIINNDSSSSGVFLDLEIYRPKMIPFYERLSKNLEENSKIFAFITRPNEATKAWFSKLGSNSFAVLYGYDLHKIGDSSMPVNPKIYSSRLQKATNHFIDVAKKSDLHFMIGIPAVATTYEWKIKIIKDDLKEINPYSQISYFKVAKEVCSNIDSAYFLGCSIWAFVENTDKQKYLPLDILSANLFLKINI